MSESTYPLDNPYQAPAADLVDSNSAVDNELFVVSTKKLFILYTATFGLYGLVWFYHHFKLSKGISNFSIGALLKSLFSIFFAHGLFKKVHQSGAASGEPANWSHFTLATAYVLIVILSNVGELVSDLFMFATFFLVPGTAYILCKVQATANVSQNDEDGSKNSRFTVPNILWSLVGSVGWLALIAVAAAVFIAPGVLETP